MPLAPSQSLTKRQLRWLQAWIAAGRPRGRLQPGGPVLGLTGVAQQRPAPAPPAAQHPQDEERQDPVGPHPPAAIDRPIERAEEARARLDRAAEAGGHEADELGRAGMDVLGHLHERALARAHLDVDPHVPALRKRRVVRGCARATVGAT